MIWPAVLVGLATAPAPDGTEVLTTITGWVLNVLGWAGGLAFIAVGGVFLYSYLGGHGSARAVRGLLAASIGCIVISSSSAIAHVLLPAPKPTPDNGFNATQTMLDTIGGWLTQVMAWASGTAFLAVGGLFCYAYLSGRGSHRALRALGGASIGCILISAGSGLGHTLMKPAGTNSGFSGVTDKLDTLTGWITSVVEWGAGIAFLVVGGIFLYAYLGGHGSSRTVRALAGVSAGCVIISASGAIANKLLTGSGAGGKGVNDGFASVTSKLTTLGDWVTGVLEWGAGIAFLVVGGIFLYAYFGGHGSHRAIRALAGVTIGCVLISAGTQIAKTLYQ